MNDLHKEDRLYKLSKGSDTARWAHDEIAMQDNKIESLQAENAELLDLAFSLAKYPEGTVRGDTAYGRLLELLDKSES